MAGELTSLETGKASISSGRNCSAHLPNCELSNYLVLLCFCPHERVVLYQMRPPRRNLVYRMNPNRSVDVFASGFLAPADLTVDKEEKLAHHTEL